MSAKLLGYFLIVLQLTINKNLDKYPPDLKVPGGSKTMQNADEERTIALRVSSRWMNHSLAAKLWKNGLAFVSMRSRFFAKKRSSSSKALMVIDPAMDSAR